MTEQKDRRQLPLGQQRPSEERLNRAREEIAARVASFRATQEKFERAREEYFETTMDNARKTARPSLWP